MQLQGQQIGRYRLMRAIGSGSMGEVYLAEDTQLNRQVAIKVALAEVSTYPGSSSVQEAARLFFREAQAIASLDHPYILPLYDYGEEIIDGKTLTFMVMPYRQEGSFADWLRQRTGSGLLSWPEIAYFIQQAADALQHAHNRQITHQDVKPANFLMRSTNKPSGLPDLLLADFGIAKMLVATVGASNTIRGTPTYMAPEQWSGNPVPASDQYALAILGYQLLTGHLPFQGQLQQVMYQHLQVQPQPPSLLNPQLPPGVDEVVLRALAKRPEERFSSVSDLASALRHALLDEGTVIRPQQILLQSLGNNTGLPTVIRVPSIPNSPDFRITLPISMAEARSGTIRTFILPNGQQLSVAIPAGANNGQIMRLDPTNSAIKAGILLLTIAVQQNEEGSVKAKSLNISPTVSVSSPKHQARKMRTISRSMTFLLALLAFLIVATSAGLLYSYFSHTTTTTKNDAQQTNVTNHTTITPTNTATNPYPPYGGTLVINDSLINNTRGYDWNDLDESTYACKFEGGAYHVIQTSIHYYTDCFAEGDKFYFTNFTFQVQMRIIEGDCGGVVFRSDPTENMFYFFRICQDGSFDLTRFVDKTNRTSTSLTSGFSSFIHTGLNVTNVVAVVVHNSEIDLYVNQQLIQRISDSAYNFGKIAVAVRDNGHSTEAAFNNAMVWAQ